MVKGRTLLNESKALVIIFILILIGQLVGYGFSPIEALPGSVIIIVIALISLIIKAAMPKIKFPAFAWASLIALFLCLPSMPTSEIVTSYIDKINFLGITTPILAFAGISVGSKVGALKKLSWKVLIVAIAVFIGTYFGSAVIAQIVLKAQGLI